jgi:imidazolonepropionase-like amidohydrolase
LAEHLVSFWKLRRKDCPPSAVVIDGGLIREDSAGVEVIDGQGGVFLPGLIDAHVHLHGEEFLKQVAQGE